MRESHSTFISRSYLRSVWADDYEAFKGTDDEARIERTLRDWAARADLREVSAEAALISNVFEGVLGYRQSGGGGGRGFTLYPQYPVKGGGAGGKTGSADAALGFFDTSGVADTMQVSVEFKKLGTNLDAAQKSRADRRSPVEQAINYLVAARRGMIGNEPIRPTWAIVTDMNEFRLYWYDRAPAQYLSFSIEQRDLLAGRGMLGTGEAARFERYLFAKTLSADTLLSRGNRSELEKLIGSSFVRQRELENTFYAEYRAYREHLYKTLVEANPSFPGTRGQLVRLAQKLLDRAIFVFYCEDMGRALGFPPQLLRDFLIEKSKNPYMDDGGHSTSIWGELKSLFAAMNDGRAFGGQKLNQFNGGLFATDPLLDGLTVPDLVFCMKGQGQNEASLYGYKRTLLYLSAAYNYAADLAEGLRPPPVAEKAEAEGEVPAEEAANRRKADPESALGLYTLGRIFEQSITELEILEAEAEERTSVNKESKRKRDGVYYTPEPIVERIVSETLGPRLHDIKIECGWPANGDDPDEAALEAYRERLRAFTVLDPACGSGAFLITALKFLVREWYELRDVRARVSGPTTEREGEQLIADVLRENLYGVDINPASVEITQLALWLHTARGDRPLSSLDHHIKSGNSLIGSEFWKGQIDLSLYNEEAKERVNVFDWEAAFPDVFEGGGFDAVIGNPPYVKLQNFRKAHADMAEFIREGRGQVHGMKSYRSAQTGNFDLFLPFIERGLELLKPGGRLGYIAPSLWTVNEYGAGLREVIARDHALDRWLDFRSHQVFEEATTYCALQFYRRSDGTDRAAHVLVADAPDGELSPRPWEGKDAALPYDRLAHGDRWLMLSGAERDLIDRLDRDCTRLEDASLTSAIFVGLQTSADAIYHLERIGTGRYRSVASGTRRDPVEVRIEDAIMHPLVSGGEAKRYISPETETYILFPYARGSGGAVRLIPAGMMERNYPLAWAYLKEHEKGLRGRERGSFDDDEWHRFGRSQNLDKQDTTKLLVPRLVASLKAAADPDGRFYLDNVDVGGVEPAEGVDPFFLAGALNGPVANFVFRRISKPFRGDYLSANRQFIAPLPIPNATEKQRADVADRARKLQRLHSERRDALADLARLIEQQPRRARRIGFLFPHALPLASREKGEDRDRAKREYETEIAAATEAIENALHADVTLEAAFERGELRLLADGAPIIAGIRLDDTEGPFIEAQWNAAADAFASGGRQTVSRLLRDLRTLIVTDNAQVRSQLIDMQTDVRRLDTEIASAEADMNDVLARLYKLTDRERRMVEGA